ncbi:MAG TPA: S41 family peptidase, partial [Vicinamibacterales bacterium]|nr:S41 family peptidase [Vicinamibacterales bacterium]
VLLISTPLLGFIIVGGLRGNAAGGDPTFQHLRVFEDVVSLILNNYVETAKIDKVMEGAMRGMADGLDPDSSYLTAADVKAIDAGASATPSGDVGLELTRQYYLRVIAARDGSPAAKAGLQTGDYIRAIDGKPARDLSVFEGGRLLRGEPGSKVTLTVIRGNAAEPRDFDLVREKTPGTIVSGKIISGDIGYVRLAAFGADVAPKLQSQIGELSKAGAKRLLIDIRNTAEGDFSRGIDASRLFVKSGTLAMVAARSRDAKPTTDTPPDKAEKVPQSAIKETIAAKPGDGAIDLPVTLLVTTGTSGAAEVFASALEGNKRADSIGERTLGRAGIQKLVRLPDGRGLWLTSERYVSPDSELIQGRGLTPDTGVDQPDLADFDQPKPATDPILDAALARLQKKAA